MGAKAICHGHLPRQDLDRDAVMTLAFSVQLRVATNYSIWIFFYCAFLKQDQQSHQLWLYNTSKHRLVVRSKRLRYNKKSSLADPLSLYLLRVLNLNSRGILNFPPTFILSNKLYIILPDWVTEAFRGTLVRDDQECRRC